MMKTLFRLVSIFILAALSLQIYFLLRVAGMAVVIPESTAFERSEVYRLLIQDRPLAWRQQWVPYTRISAQLKRAVIASEDANFSGHSGVEWEAIEKAWERNLKAQELARNRDEKRAQRRSADQRTLSDTPRKSQAKIVGGSTITQQLAKNLFLSGERHIGRKAQEFIITGMLETLLSKERILEIYLNHVEWGEGVFGAQAASERYFKISASELNALQAARLAVMLPAPKRFEKRPHSAYITGRASTVMARMKLVELP
jgi:monofunctional biosynthetic peptidoglycan transglycosylase